MTYPKNKKAHFGNVAALGCCICGELPAQIHHVHGGSIQQKLTSLGFEPTRSASQRGYGDALVVPLCAYHHTGTKGIDGGMGSRGWELHYKPQAELLDLVSIQVGYDLWALWVEWRGDGLPKIVGRR